MSMPSQNAHMRNLRSMSPDWLSEKVTLRHYSRPNTGGDLDPVWEGEVRAAVRPYDQRWGQFREHEAVEYSQAEFFFGIRKSQNDPVVMADLNRGDELEWQGRAFTINQVDSTVWADAYAVYVEALA